MDGKVDEYINRQDSPQKEICVKLREIIHGTFPSINEGFKNGVPWYEDRYYIVGLRDSVNLGFSVQGLSEKDAANFKGKGKYMRHLKFRSLDEIDEEKIVKLLKLVKNEATIYD